MNHKALLSQKQYIVDSTSVYKWIHLSGYVRLSMGISIDNDYDCGYICNSYYNRGTMRTRWSTLTLFWLNGSGENLHICGRIGSKKEVARVRINPTVDLSLFYHNDISQRSTALGIITVMMKNFNHRDKGYCTQMRTEMGKYGTK